MKTLITAIQLIALLVLIGRGGTYEHGDISGSEFALSAVICLAVMALGIAADRALEGTSDEG